MDIYYLNLRYKQELYNSLLTSSVKDFKIHFSNLDALKYDFKHVHNSFSLKPFSINLDKNPRQPVFVFQKNINDILKNFDNGSEFKDHHKILCPRCYRLKPATLHDMDIDRVTMKNEKNNSKFIAQDYKYTFTKKVKLKDSIGEHKIHYNNNVNIINSDSSIKLIGYDTSTAYEPYTSARITSSSCIEDTMISAGTTTSNYPQEYEYQIFNFNHQKKFNIICDCGFSVTSNECIISDFKNKVTLPHKIIIDEVQDSISLTMMFQEIEFKNKLPTFTPCYIRLNFNCKNGNTTLIKSYYTSKNSLVKEKFKRIQNKINSSDVTIKGRIEKYLKIFDSILNEDAYEKLVKRIYAKHISIIEEELNTKNGANIIENPFVNPNYDRGLRGENGYNGSYFASNNNLITSYKNRFGFADGHYLNYAKLEPYADLNENTPIRVLPAIIMYNRFPRIPKLKSFFKNIFNERVENQLKSLKCHEDPVAHFMKILKIKDCKSIRKLAHSSLQTIFKYPRANCYFKDINNILKIIDFGIFTNYGKDYRKIKRGEKVYNNEFLNLLFSKFDETQIVKKIYNDSFYLRDTNKMYLQILKKYGSIYNIKHLEPDFLNGNLKKIHDYFSYLVDLIDEENLPLRNNIDKELIKLETENDTYKLRFAYTTHELKSIGRKMNICVGSYAKKAIEKRCHIIVVLEKQKYVACIELNPQYKRIWQVKAHSNDYVEGHLKTFIQDWIFKNELEVFTHDIELPNLNHNRTSLNAFDGRLTTNYWQSINQALPRGVITMCSQA